MATGKGKHEAGMKQKIEKAALPDFSVMEDPFTENDEENASGIALFFHSRRGKIITITAVTVCVIAAMVAGFAFYLKSWIKPPELPMKNPDNLNTEISDVNPNVPQEPDEEDMYPDDGYRGDMPTVSGDRKEGVYTFLLVGTDMDDGNTDTIMVASYDTVNQAVSIMSIPRDTMINEKWDIKKINSVYARTGSSITSLAKRVQKLVGFRPDFYVKVDLDMFVELVDLVEGVEFDVPCDMNYEDPAQGLYIHLKKGRQTLDGEKAMQLVRFRRYSEGDIKRIEVQQDFVKALIAECLSMKNWGKLKSYIDLAMKNVETDLESGAVVWFAASVLGLNGTSALKMEDVYTCTIPGDYWGSAWSRDTDQEQSYVTIYPKEVVTLVNDRFNPYKADVTTNMLDAMRILKNGDIASSTGSLADKQHNRIMMVRRGEAYYDKNGNLVMGSPSSEPEKDDEPKKDNKPKKDKNGNYYILDENGNTIFTDKNGNPLSNSTTPSGGNTTPDTTGEPGTTTTPGITSEPGTTTIPGTTGEPGTTTTSGTAGQPGTMTIPGTTGEPGATTTPGTTGQPGTMTIPGTTGEPGATTTPGTTGQSETMTIPGTTGEPGTTITPGIIDESGTATTPGITGELGATTIPDITGEPGTATTPGTTDEPGATTIPDITGEPGTTTTSGTTDEPGAATVPDITSQPETTAIPGSISEPDISPAIPDVPDTPAAPEESGETGMPKPAESTADETGTIPQAEE